MLRVPLSPPIKAGVPALATRAATWRLLTRSAPVALLAEAIGHSPATPTCHAELARTDYIRYVAR